MTLTLLPDGTRLDDHDCDGCDACAAAVEAEPEVEVLDWWDGEPQGVRATWRGVEVRLSQREQESECVRIREDEREAIEDGRAEWRAEF